MREILKNELIFTINNLNVFKINVSREKPKNIMLSLKLRKMERKCTFLNVQK